MRPTVLVHNQLSPSILECIFLYYILKEKAKLSVSSAWWLLNRGDNNGNSHWDGKKVAAAA